MTVRDVDAGATRLGVTALLALGPLSGSRRYGVASEGSLVEHIASQLGHRGARGIVLCGPLRANQKPVVQLFDRRGRTLAYVKVAWNDLTRRLLEDEHAALARLGAISDRGFAVPPVLASGAFASAQWLALGPVGVERRTRADDAALDALACAIERTGQSWHGDVDDSGYVDTLTAAAAGLPASQEALVRLAERWSGHAITLAASHGDFVPWNTLSGSPESAVWDWERYRVAAPRGFDRLHLRSQVGVHRRGVPLPDTLRQLGRELDEVLADLPPEQRHIHFDYYIADLLCRYESDSSHDPDRLPGYVEGLGLVLKERHASI